MLMEVVQGNELERWTIELAWPVLQKEVESLFIN